METFLQLSQIIEDADSRLVRDTVLAYEQPALWLLALKNMPRKELLERRRELLERIPRAEQEYERYLFNVLVSEKDPHVVPYVEKKINTASLSLEEKKRWVHALAAIGGEKAIIRLRRILSSTGIPVELRVTAALSLGKLRDLESQNAMEEILRKKFFGNKALKEACQKALNRMSTLSNRGPV